MLRNITSRLDDTSKDTMEQIMREWKQRKRGVSTYDTGASGPGNVTLPLSPGEWDEPLGCPVCVACHRVRDAGEERLDLVKLTVSTCRLIRSMLWK